MPNLLTIIIAFNPKFRRQVVMSLAGSLADLPPELQVCVRDGRSTEAEFGRADAAVAQVANCIKPVEHMGKTFLDAVRCVGCEEHVIIVVTDRAGSAVDRSMAGIPSPESLPMSAFKAHLVQFGCCQPATSPAFEVRQVEVDGVTEAVRDIIYADH